MAAEAGCAGGALGQRATPVEQPGSGDGRGPGTQGPPRPVAGPPPGGGAEAMPDGIDGHSDTAGIRSAAARNDHDDAEEVPQGSPCLPTRGSEDRAAPAEKLR